MKLHRFDLIAFISSLFFFWIIFISPNEASLQAVNCPPISALFPGNPIKGIWRQGVTVEVNIDPAFTTDQQNAIVAAITSWNNAASELGNGCNVSFAQPTFNPGKLLPSFTAARCQITKGPVSNAQANCTWGGTSTSREYAEITMDTNKIFTFPGWFQHVAAHELGHSFGLENCNSCDPCKSVMSAPGICSPVSPGGPTDCDNEKVRQYGHAV